MKLLEYLFNLPNDFGEQLNNIIDNYLEITNLTSKKKEVIETIKKYINDEEYIQQSLIIEDTLIAISLLIANHYYNIGYHISTSLYINTIYDSKIIIYDKNKEKLELNNFNKEEFLAFIQKFKIKNI